MTDSATTGEIWSSFSVGIVVDGYCVNWSGRRRRLLPLRPQPLGSRGVVLGGVGGLAGVGELVVELAMRNCFNGGGLLINNWMCQTCSAYLGNACRSDWRGLLGSLFPKTPEPEVLKLRGAVTEYTN